MTKTTSKEPAKTPAVKGTYGTMYYVQDMVRSAGWLKSRLGIKPSYESPEWTEFGLDGHSLCLHIEGDGEGKGAGSNGSLILHVDGIKALVDTLRVQGVRIETEPHEVHPGAWAATIVDPDGNLIGLYEGPKSC